MKLTPEQLEQFRTEGWLFLPELFTPEEVDVEEALAELVGIGFAGSSQAHALRGAVEQYNAQPALEVGDAPAHGGRGNAFALGSPADGAGLGQQEDEARRNAVERCHVVSLWHHTHRRQISKEMPRAM